MNHRWIISPPRPLLTAALSARLGVSGLLAQCLVNRDLANPENAASFLSPRLRELADPFLLPGMATAVDRLYRARASGERIVVFGDYDVDGVTSTTLLLAVFERLGWVANHYLPNRMDEGYGLSREAVENCLRTHPGTLLLAVDCGSTAVETVAALRQKGVDVIVLDHHQVSNPPPDAVALVNPQLSTATGAEGSSRSFRELCSAGLAFKLAHALVKRGRDLGLASARELDIRQFLDLVALGTIADIVPLVGENRILVSAGLERLNTTDRPGIVALKEVAQINGPVGVYEVGFQLAPRLNAAGRLENAERSLHLLRARNRAEADPIAHELDAQNRERQRIERNIADEVAGAVRARFNPATDYVIVEGQLLWHIGVVGIVASRVMREFHRPTLILGGDAAEWRGSGRSIEGFDLAAALRQCDDLLVRHGGHAMAAGLTVHPDKLDSLRARLNELARSALTTEQLRPALRVDAEVTLGSVTTGFLEELNRLEPFGQGNPGVQFVSRFLKHHRPPQPLGKERRHLKLWVTDGTVSHEAVWWNAAERTPVKPPFDLVFSPQTNEFNGRRTIQLKVLDCRESGVPD
jgi:single-stranded-DNA-specific exonuclease